MMLRGIRSTFVFFSLFALTACEPPASSKPGASPSSSAAARSSPRGPVDKGAHKAPLRWTSENLAKWRKRVKDKADVTKIPETPAVGEPSPVLHDLVEGREVLTMSEFDVRRGRADIPKGAHGALVDVHSLPFRRAPWPRITSDGTLTLKWETLQPRRAISVYFGTSVPEDDLAMPRYRKRSTAVKSDAEGLTHEVAYPLPKLFKAKYDIARTRATGRGIVEFRFEIVNDEHATTQLHDDRVAFRCEPLPCGEDAKYVQLPTTTMGPAVDMVTPTSAVVSWTTDVPTAGHVLVRGPGRQDRLVASSNPGKRHEVKLAKLRAATGYRYRVLSIDHRGEVADAGPGTFRTAPDSPEPFSFAVLSDSRSGNDVGEASYGGMNRQVLLDLLTRAYRSDVRFAVFAGDLVDGYASVPNAFRMEIRSWQKSVEPIARHLPIYEGMGNHEALIEAWSPGWAIDRREGPNAETVFAEFVVNPENGPKPAAEGAPPFQENVFSFDYAHAHFAVVNSNYQYRSHYDRKDHPGGGGGFREGAVTDEQLAWLDDDLAAARKRGAKHLFVFTHEPSFPNGGHVQDAMYWHGKVPDMNERRRRFWGTLVKHRVLAAFFGDEHNYSRTLIDETVHASYTTPVWSIISGGAGAPYYAQNESVPWAKNVKAFSAHQHFVRLEVDGDRVVARAVDRTGSEFDRVVLSERR